MGLLLLDGTNSVLYDGRLGRIVSLVNFVPCWQTIDHEEGDLCLDV